jgi:hypothetical protein
MAAREDALFARIASRRGLLAREELAAARDAQRALQKRGLDLSLLEVLVSRGALTADDVRELVEDAAQEAPGAPRRPAWPKLVVGGVVVAAAGLLAAIVIAAQRREGGPTPTAPAPSARAERPPLERGPVEGEAERERDIGRAAARPSPARRRLDEVRGWMDAELTRHEEIRRALEGFPAEFPGAPEAAEAGRLLSEVEERHARLADSALGQAMSEARRLAAEGRYDEAELALGSVGARFGESDWYRRRGEAEIAREVARIREAGLARAEAALSRAREALDSGDVDSARLALGPAMRSPAVRPRAEALLKEIEGRATRAEVALAREEFWPKFVVDLIEAGRKGVGEAEALVARERAKIVELGLEEKLRVVERRLGDARFVDELAVEGFRASRRIVRVHRMGRPVAGSVVAVEGGVLRLRPPVGDVIEVPLTEIAPEEIAEAAGLLGKGTGDPVKAARYYLVRGDVDAAREQSRMARGWEADEVRREIFEAASALAALRPARPPTAPAPPADEAASSAARPAEEEPPPPPAEPPAAVSGPVALPGPPPPREELPKGPRKPLPGETGMPGQWAPGLVCEIFRGTEARRRIGVRIDPAINFAFGPSGPDLAAEGDGFTIRWTGWLLVPYDGEYVFSAPGDDRLEVELDGKLLVTGEGGRSDPSPPRRLEAGLHRISATLVEERGGSRASLRWLPPHPGTPYPIADDYYFHQVPRPGEMGPFAELVSGAWAEYYVGHSFERKAAEGPVADLRYDLGALPVCTACPEDGFSVRLTGYLLARGEGSYAFKFTVNDGVRMTVDGKTVIDRWGPVPQGEIVSPRFELRPGYRRFVIEHHDLTGAERLSVAWGTEVGKYGRIRNHEVFRPAREAAVVDRRGLAPGMQGALYGSERPGAGPIRQTRYDPAAWFYWGRTPPAPGLRADEFSGVWKGVLVAPKKGKYTFMVRRDGGVKLTLGGRTVINQLTGRSSTVDGSLVLPAGKIPFVFTYSNDYRDALARVLWSGPDFTFRKLGAGALGHVAQELPFAKPWE